MNSELIFQAWTLETELVGRLKQDLRIIKARIANARYVYFALAAIVIVVVAF